MKNSSKLMLLALFVLGSVASETICRMMIEEELGAPTQSTTTTTATPTTTQTYQESLQTQADKYREMGYNDLADQLEARAEKMEIE